MLMLDVIENKKIEVVLKSYRTVEGQDIFLSQECIWPCMSEQSK